MISSYNYLVLVGEGAQPFAGFLNLRCYPLIGEIPRVDEYVPIWDGEIYWVVMCVGNANYFQSVGPFKFMAGDQGIEPCSGGSKPPGSP